MTIRGQPDQSATPAEISAFAEARSGMTMGWTGSFDKMEGLIADTVTA